MKIKLKEIGCEGVDWIDLAQDTDKWRVLAKTAMNLWFPYSVGNSFSTWGSIRFPRGTLLHSFRHM